MPPSRAAERQKEYRERLKTLHPEKYAEAKRKNAERMKRNRKRISQCNEDEKKSLRQEWRNKKKKKNEEDKSGSACESFFEWTESTVGGKESIERNTKSEKKESSTVTNMKLDEKYNEVEIERVFEHSVNEESTKLITESEKFKTFTVTDNKTESIASVPSLQILAFSKCSLYFQNFEKEATNDKKTEELRNKWREYKFKNKERKMEHEKQLEKWREYKRRGKIVENMSTNLVAANKKLKQQITALKTDVISLRKQLKKNRQKLKRIQNKNQELIDKVNKLQNEYYIDVAKNTNASSYNDTTPITKSVDNFINENLPRISELDKEKVKRKLTEQTVFINSVKCAYQSAKDNKSKQSIKSFILDNEKVKQYKLKTKLATYLGLKGKIRHSHTKKKFTSLHDKFQEFYERDDVSRATAGKKEVKVQKKSKKQRRYLLSSLKTLYKKYKSEGGIFSYSTFKKYRPFYVISPKANTRNTCACIKHENLSFKLKALRSIKVLKCQSLDDLLSLTVCDLKSKECAYDECEACRNKKVEFCHDTTMLNNNVSWYEWTTKAHEYKEKNSEGMKTTKKVVKEMKTAPLENLIHAFSQELDKFKRHAYNIYHQYAEYKNCIKNLDDYSVLFHIDYSENYACKLNTEVQSMHFGASRQQITLHTGVMYVKGEKPVSFCSLSGNNYHGPEAIWAHMSPVLDFVKQKYPFITKAHFYSDGPTTQYRQKKNFYLFSVHMKKYGFTVSTWNFSEASHGKGAADGVGGAIKRKLDSFVNCGLDITNAETAFQLLHQSDTTVKVFLIPEDSIHMLTVELNTIPGTMTIHQIVCTPSDEIYYRSLSCFCFVTDNSNVALCNCYDLKKMCLEKPEQSTKKENTKGVTILSDIKNTRENRKYLRLVEYFDPLANKKVNPGHDIYLDFIENSEPNSSSARRLNVERTSDDIPIPTTSGKGKEVTNKTLPIKRKLPHTEIVTKKQKTVTVISPNQYDIDDDVHDDNRSSKKINNVKMGNENLPMEENVEFLDEDLLCQDDISDNLIEDTVKISDSVLVRYYEKNNWKYYIGFVEKITPENDTYLYSVLFLKTVKNPLKFVTTRKRDYDTVPMLSVVKKIELVQHEQRRNEYLLKNNSDSVYFNK